MSEKSKFSFKKFDIRVKPPGGKPDPSELRCEWAGCVEKGGCKAPKSPDTIREYYSFCTKHAREYNKNWNFFSGMSDEDVSQWQVGARHGHRPTWDVRKNTGERAKTRKGARVGDAAFSDSYSIFGQGDDVPTEAPRRRLSKLQIKALNDLGLDEFSGPNMVRERYTMLVKQLHPDANGGDRSTEVSFQRVVKAYKVLKTTNLA
ncbi:MAG: J domain-containing protein [Robiginitomaculum sp.]